MKRFIFISVLFFIANCTNAQLYDMQWVFGYGYYEEGGWGISLLDFNDGEVQCSFYTESEDYALNFGGSFINDAYGNLLMHTNGCEIRDANWNTIEGSGDSLLTSTGAAANTCTDGGNNYGAFQNCVLIPNLIDDSKYYLLHKDLRVNWNNETGYSDDLWLSKIEIDQNQELKYLGKSKINDTRYLDARHTVCPNKAKTGWWNVQPILDSENFDVYLIDSLGEVKKDLCEVDGHIHWHTRDIGQAQFSPNGKKYAINRDRFGVFVYDFDNETGKLSNFVQIPYPDSENVAQGLCFSPNSRFIYVTTAENVYQLDLENDNEVFHLGYYRSLDSTGWSVGLGMIFGGPDCRLYVSPGLPTFNMHVILYPDEKGKDCQFVESAIRLPARVNHHLPNIAQFRYLNPCDANIAFPFTVSIDELERQKLYAYPNPVKDILRVTGFEKYLESKQLKFYNSVGLEMNCPIAINGLELEIDVSSLAVGIYYLTDPEGSFEAIKFVKME